MDHPGLEALLSFDRVTKSYVDATKQRSVLSDVTLELHRGEFTVITGPSGSGKTTFLNLSALIDTPSAGAVSFAGRSTAGLSETDLAALRKTSIGMVFQQYCLLPRRSVFENVLFRFRYMDTPWLDRVDQTNRAIDLVGLTAVSNAPVYTLSGGEMQRVGVARAVAAQPDLLVADEPTGNLDTTSAGLVMECLAALNRERSVTVLLVTHNERLLTYASRHLRCDGGQIYEA